MRLGNDCTFSPHLILFDKGETFSKQIINTTAQTH